MNQPNPIFEGPAAWYGPDMAKTEEWIYQLTQQEVDEVDAALANVLEQSIAAIDVNRKNFPLPTFGKVLSDIQNEVVYGRGFVLIRGIPVKRYSIEESVIVYWGMGAYLGQAVPQNAQGHLLGHIKDLGNDPHDPLTRVYTTNYRQPYHTDSCDVVALLCLNKAKSGGLSTISSSTTIYNEMMQQRPDLVEVLFEPFIIDRKGEIPKGKLPTYQMPVFHHYAGHLTTIYARDFIEAAQQRHADIPRLTAQQLEALDMLDSLARSEAIRLDMAFEPGDIQLLHNHQILHARTAYEDFTEPEHRRHLLRLWLSQPDGRPLPPVFEERYGNIELGTRRGGIIVPGTVENIPMETV
jgi:hypothetical protein